MVLEAGIEPACPTERGILSPLCLPIPPLKHDNNIALTHNIVKGFIKKKCPQDGGDLFIDGGVGVDGDSVDGVGVCFHDDNDDGDLVSQDDLDP